MNVVDALVVTLGLDAEGFKKGTKEAEQAQEEFTKKTEQDSKKREQQSKKASAAETKRAQQFHKQAKETAEQFRKIKTQALGLAAVFTGGLGIEQFMSQTMNSSANAFEMSRNMNMSARQIGALQGVMEQFGSSAQEANGHIQEIQKSINAYKVGNLEGPLQGFARWGGDKVENVSDIQTPLQYYRAAAQYAGQNPDNLSKTEMTHNLRKMGIHGAMLSAVRGGLASFNRRYHQSESNSYTNASAKAMQKFREQMVHLDRQLQAIGRHMMTAMLPDIEKLLHGVQDFANWAGSHQKQISSFFTDLGNDIEQFLETIDKVAKDMGIIPKGQSTTSSSSGTSTGSKSNPSHGTSNFSASKFLWGVTKGTAEATGGILDSILGIGSGKARANKLVNEYDPKKGVHVGMARIVPDNHPLYGLLSPMASAMRSFGSSQLGVPNVNDYWRRIHGGTVHNTTNHTTVGDVTVNTQASDAQGTADALHSRLYSLTPLADTAEQ